jgi:hypothetical protein
MYPIVNEDNTINWKNMFRTDWITVLLIVGIILMLIGMGQITEQCRVIVKNPCAFTHDKSGLDLCIKSPDNLASKEYQFPIPSPS